MSEKGKCFSVKLTLFIATCAFLLSSCTGVKNTIIPDDVSKWDTELKPKIEKLSDQDKELLTGYLMRSKMSEAFGGKQESGITIGKAIENQKAWKAEREKKDLEAKLLKEKLEKEQAALQKQVEEMLTVTVLKMKLEEASYETNQIIKLGFKNNGTKDISGIKGTVHFVDMFDKEVGSVGFSYTDGIKAGATAKWEGSRRYNRFMDEHRALAGLEEGKYTSRFQPEMIVFKDGTKLTVSK